MGRDGPRDGGLALRIAIVSQEYPPVTDYWGGIGTQYGRLAPALAALGHEVHAIVLAPGGGTPPAPELEGVHMHAVARPRVWPWYPIAWSRRVDARLRDLAPLDVVLTPEFRAEGFAYARHRSAGPLVTHLLTSSEQLLSLRPGLRWRERNGFRARLGRFAERRQAETSDAVLAPGAAILRWARELWDLEDVPARVLPLTIEPDGVRAQARGEPPEGFPATGPVVTLASRLDGHKGAQQLVQAMHCVWRTHPEAQLVFVGRDAPFEGRMMSDHLRELAGERLGQVHILGYQPWDRYFAAVAASDVVAIPSLWESFCLAAVEAMALGRPVVGTRDNGFSEFIADGENGLLVDRGSVEELAAALERLLGDAALRARLGEAARRTADTLDAAVVAPRYVEALESLDGWRRSSA